LSCVALRGRYATQDFLHSGAAVALSGRSRGPGFRHRFSEKTTFIYPQGIRSRGRKRPYQHVSRAEVHTSCNMFGCRLCEPVTSSSPAYEGRPWFPKGSHKVVQNSRQHHVLHDIVEAVCSHILQQPPGNATSGVHAVSLAPRQRGSGRHPARNAPRASKRRQS